MSTEPSKRTITATRNYRLFTFSAENRPRSAKKHKRLLASMRQYGFIPSFPVVCVRTPEGALEVRDGQHRLMFAEELGLPVFYTVEATDFDVAVVNSTAKTWTLIDYAQKFASNGDSAYVEGLEFADRHKLAIGAAFSLLAGTTTFSNVHERFIAGAFEITDREWADAVAGLYVALTDISKELNTQRCLEACMAVCRVEGFQADRLVSGARRHREALKSYSTRDGFLEMFEVVYNFGRKQLSPLKVLAIQVMRDRNASIAAAAKKAS